MKFRLSCSSKRNLRVWPARPWSSDVTSNDLLLGPSWMSGSPGRVVKTVCRTLLLASRIWTRNSWVVVRNWLAKFWIRSDQLRVARGTAVGTVNDWVMFRTPGPVEVVSASKDPAIGGWGVAGPG